MLADVFLNARVAISAGRARRNVMEHFGVFQTVLPPQLAIAGEDELSDVIAIRRNVVIAEQR